MSMKWLAGFILIAFLPVVGWVEGASPAWSQKPGTNEPKQVVSKAGTAASPGQGAKPKRIVDVRLENKNGLTHLTIIGDGELGKYETLRLSAPPRLVLDMKGVGLRFPKLLVSNENPLIKEVRIGRHPDRVRFVFHPKEASLPPFEIERGKDRLVITFGASAKTSPIGVASRQTMAKAQGSTSPALKTTGSETVSKEKSPQPESKAEGQGKVAQAGEIKKETEPTPAVQKIPETGGPSAAEKETIQLKMSISDPGPKPAAPDVMTLEESIKIALDRNLRLHSATMGVLASEFRTKAAYADFFPKWTAQYNYTHYSKPQNIDTVSSVSRVPVWVPDPATCDTCGKWVSRLVFAGIPTADRDIFSLSSGISQPIFSGGSLSANYRIEKIGIEISKGNVEIAKRDIVLAVREVYFNILTAEKAVEVAQQAVKQFEAQLEVSKAFFEVGIVAKNDVLQAEVRLANARQGLVRAENAVAKTKAAFNTLLRREVSAPLKVVDILEYKPYPIRFEESVEEGLRGRPEIKNAQLTVDSAKEAVKVAKAGFYPTISLAGSYSATSEEPSLFGDLRSRKWNGQALATFTIFEWGKTTYKVGESKVRVTQVEDSKNQLIEGIALEVKEAYLNMLEAEKNIGVAEKSVEQAEENLRLNEERYKYQVATQTEVLDAVTLLAQARSNYYSALSDFNIAKARLDRSMGRMYP